MGVSVTAENASQAMHRLQTHPGVGLIFTDLLMPGPMDGRELIHHLRCDGCDLPAILTSGIGYAPPFLPTRTRFLNKPYKRAHLVSHIEQFIAA
ncbi:response regulator [Xanthomonas citri pv. citri]